MPRDGNGDVDCDVLIAGFGPVGATLAALLGRRGLSVIVVEPEHDVYPLPRAAHIDHEIMRIFQALGIVESLRPHSRPAPDYEFHTAAGGLLMRVERDGVLGASGWPTSFNIHQPGVERALRATVAALPNVRVLHGARFIELTGNDAHHVIAAVARDGTATQYTARFLVGCDGARSPVRETIGGGLVDYAFDEPWLVLDATVEDERAFPPVNLQRCDPDRPTTFVHMGPGRLRWEFMLKPGEDPAAMKSDDAIDPLLARWRRHGAIAVERRAVYRFHGLVARRWREGSAFIAGDAAHQMPPFMGQGLCSGLRDAANLAWKLAAVLAGGAVDPDAVLDSYQTEREPHVRFVIERAIDMGRLVCTLDADRAASRDAALLPAPRIAPPSPFPPLAAGCVLPGSAGTGTIFPQPVDVGGAGRLDDRLGGGAWLIHRDRFSIGSDSPAGAAGNTSLAVIDLAALAAGFRRPIAEWLDRHAAEAVLVRPDRYVFGTGTADRLWQAYAAWLRPLATTGANAAPVHRAPAPLISPA